MIYALNNRQSSMSQSKLFQKPLQNIEEYVDEPKVDIKKIKNLTGEIKIPVSQEKWSLTGAISQFYFDLSFYLGLVGRHERSKCQLNRKYLTIAVLLVSVAFIGFQGCQNLSESLPATGTGASISAHVQAQMTRSQNVMDATTKADAVGVSNAMEDTRANQADSTPEAPEEIEVISPVAQYNTAPAPVTVIQPVGRHAPKPTGHFYASATANAGTAAGQPTSAPNTSASTEVTAAPEAPVATPPVAPAKRVSNAHNQSHM